MAEIPDPDRKRSRWKSLLNVLLDWGVEEHDVVMVETAVSANWEFAFWSDDPDGIPVTYRCKVGRKIWEPVETPVYTGAVRPFDQERRGGEQPYHGDPDPK